MVVPIMVLLFLREKLSKMTDKSSEKGEFFKGLTYKKRSTILGSTWYFYRQ